MPFRTPARLYKLYKLESRTTGLFEAAHLHEHRRLGISRRNRRALEHVTLVGALDEACRGCAGS